MNKIYLLGLALILVGCQSTSNVKTETTEDMKVAEVALMNGKPESAMDLYRKLLAANPDDPQLLLLMGSAANQASRYDEALHYLQRGIELNQSSAIYRELGRAWLALGEIEQATSALEESVRLEASDDVAQNSLGVSYSLNKQYSKARESYSHALSLMPSSNEYRNNLAMAWILDGRPEQGIRILHPIFVRGEASVKLQLNLALAYALSGDSDSAKSIARAHLSQPEYANNSLYYQELAAQADKGAQ
ncbi:tetratricopeptide repeat protein [Vibrio sp. ED004]|uniref:tetratricopeptide repeat protein n=1 Tax=unclassified Vibrio TaxID=2614977 RepID=UPI0002F8B3A9|nr:MULTISPECIES: tetratricopeptide repeat protein [unclassified Vibrio]UPR59210.1 tetratricopeptide repeat protein [Vibrio sp. ED004]